METFGDFLLLVLQQFAGGPGPVENNLMRFGLAAVFWLGLLLVAWSRQRDQHLPREKLLVWGFGLALTRELMMLGLTILQIIGFLDSGREDIYYHPLEHALEVAALIVVAGAFLRYALNDERISYRYLWVGLSLIVIFLLITYITWPKFSNDNPGIKFSERWEAWIFHILSFTLMAVAIFVLARARGWLRSVVSSALSFFLISEFLRLASYATNNIYTYALCPISNTFHILAIPIFGFVYLKEMSIEKKKAEDDLEDYRDHLEDLVAERTAMLVAQNEIADSLSQSLDLTTILDIALDKVLSVLSLGVGLTFLFDQNSREFTLGSYRGCLSPDDLELCIREGCPYEKIARTAIKEKQIIVQTLNSETPFKSAHIEKENIQMLIGAPLISKNKIIGAITLGSKQMASLDQTDLALLAAVCNQVGMAVENAYLYQEAEIWASELSTLHQASIKLGSTLDAAQINREIVSQSIKLTGRQAACVHSWDKKEHILTCVASEGFDPEMEVVLLQNPDDEHLFAQLCEEQSSIVIEDIALDLRIPGVWKEVLGSYSLLCVPLWNNRKKAENLFIMDQSKRKPWRSKDVELVESFVSRAAVALENAHLHKQLEWAATLEERQRIAANMHDGLAQTISLLGLKVDHAAQLFPADQNGDLLDALDNIQDTVQQASVDVRKSIASLQNMPEPRKSLQELLDSLVAEWVQQGDLAFDANFSFPAPLILSPEQSVQLMPILQETMVNIRKHAKATSVSVYGEEFDETVIITIQDNGIGFDLEKVNQQGNDHFGLKIMRARAARLGCELKITSQPDAGTTMTLSGVLGDEAEYRLMHKPLKEGESHA